MVAITAVAVWVLLVVITQVLTPEQSPLSMGMSGLVRGRARRIVKVAFVVRGMAAMAGASVRAVERPPHAGMPAPLRVVGRYAGLLQRVFIALVMVWTVVVAAGI